MAQNSNLSHTCWEKLAVAVPVDSERGVPCRGDLGLEVNSLALVDLEVSNGGGELGRPVVDGLLLFHPPALCLLFHVLQIDHFGLGLLPERKGTDVCNLPLFDFVWITLQKRSGKQDITKALVKL